MKTNQPKPLPCVRRASAAALIAGATLLGSEPAPAADDGFAFKDVSDRSVGLYDHGKPVLVYNFGVINPPAGAPADRARSTYVHPLYGLDGEILTDDFPKDHYHHRGLFWAWPHVIIGGKEYDLWMLKGIEQRFEKWLARETTTNAATLAVQNGWYVGTNRVMEETVRLRIGPVRGDSRAVDVDLTLKPTTEPVTLRGAEGKSYGGLTFRSAPGTNTAITIPSGVTGVDLPITNLPWADLTRLLPGQANTSGAAIFIAPTHPNFPPEWLTRHYGVLCVGWPGVNNRTLPAGEEMKFSYRVWIHRGAATPERLASAYAAWAGPGAWRRKSP